MKLYKHGGGEIGSQIIWAFKIWVPSGKKKSFGNTALDTAQS